MTQLFLAVPGIISYQVHRGVKLIFFFLSFSRFREAIGEAVCGGK